MAAAVRGLGISAYNVLENWETAYLLARVALSLGRTAGALEGLARDQATAASTYHQSMAHKATGLRRHADAAAHLELGAQYAQDEAERRQRSEIALGASARLRPDAVASAKNRITEALDGQVQAFWQEIERSSHDPATEEPAGAEVVTPSSQPRSRSFSRRGVAIVLGTAVVALIVAGAVYMSSRDHTSGPGTASAPVALTPTSAAEARLRKAGALVNRGFRRQLVTLVSAAEEIDEYTRSSADIRSPNVLHCQGEFCA